MSKDGTTKLTYLQRDVLQSAGLWRRDAANPDAAGRAVPVPGGPTVPNRFAAAPPLGRPALPGANYASPSF
jgi:hypothetical protein